MSSLSRVLLGAALTVLGACATKNGPSSQTPGPRATSAAFAPAEAERIEAAQRWVEAAAQERGLDRDLLNGMIWVESRFRADAQSPAGALGLMQLMPATARELGRKLGERARPREPSFNVRAGALYLASLLRRYQGQEALAIAAYHAGPGNVDPWADHPRRMPEYSRAYLERVATARERFTAWRKVRPSAPPRPPAPEEEPDRRTQLATGFAARPDPSPSRARTPPRAAELASDPPARVPRTPAPPPIPDPTLEPDPPDAAAAAGLPSVLD